MNKRIFLIPLLGGLAASLTAYVPLYRWLPAQVTAEWTFAPAPPPVLWLAATALVLLLSGALGARLSGTRTRLQAALSGAVIGLLAAWVVEALLGGAAAGVWGSRLILEHGLHATRDESEFRFLIAHSTLSTVVWVYLSIWMSAAAGFLLGGLGGLLAGPAGPPAREQNGLWLAICALTTPIAALTLIVTTTTFSLMTPLLENAFDEINLLPPYPPQSAFILPVVTSLAWLFFWQVLAWRMVRKAAPHRTLRPLVMAVMSVGIVIGTGWLAAPFLFWFPEELSIGFYLAVILLCYLLTAVLAWAAGKVRFRPRRLPASTTQRSLIRRIGAFLHRQGEARIAGGYFLLINLLTLVIMLRIIGKDALRYPWLLVVLAVGVGLGALGLLQARGGQPSEAEPQEQPDSLLQREYAFIGAVSGLFNVLVMILSSLAPLSLVLLTVVMIAPLSQHDEAAALASVDRSLAEVIGFHYRFSAILFFNLMATLPIYALLFSALGVIYEKWRQSRL